MSAVGTDAAYMLEKALEEMDDIFKEEEEAQKRSSHTFIQHGSSTPIQTKTSSNQNRSSRRMENSRDLIKLLDELEFLLSGQQDNEESFMKSSEKEAVLNYCKTLSFVSFFFKEFFSNKAKVGIF